MSGQGEPQLPEDQPKNFLVPSPLITRRMRTLSQSQRAGSGPTYNGTIKEFCREKGRGFVTLENSKETYFVHIHDIEGEYVPQVGDEVTFKTAPIPPKNEKLQAVHVNITHLAPGTQHVCWDSPLSTLNSPH